MNKEMDFLIEWGVWANLDSEKDIELILLKGHLLLENVLEIVLKRNRTPNIEMISFYKKYCYSSTVSFRLFSTKLKRNCL